MEKNNDIYVLFQNGFITQQQYSDAQKYGGVIKNLPPDVLLSIMSSETIRKYRKSYIDPINLLRSITKLVNAAMLLPPNERPQPKFIINYVCCIDQMIDTSGCFSNNSVDNYCIKLYAEMYQLNICLLLFAPNNTNNQWDVGMMWHCMNGIARIATKFHLNDYEKLFSEMLCKQLSSWSKINNYVTFTNYGEIDPRREDKENLLCNELKLSLLSLIKLQIDNPSLKLEKFNYEDLKKIYKKLQLNVEKQQGQQDQIAIEPVLNNNLQQQTQQQTQQQIQQQMQQILERIQHDKTRNLQ